MFCASCGAAVPVGARFCGACGVRVALVDHPGERSASDVRRRARWPMVVGIAVTALIAVIAGLAVLGDRSGTTPSDRAKTMDTAQQVEVTALTGSPVDASVSVASVDGLRGDRSVEVVGAIYDVSVSDGVSGPFRLTLPAVTDDPSSELISTWDTQLGMWLPVETIVDGDDLVAEVEHLSLWGSVASWVQYRVGLLTGNRAREPECGRPPEWASEIVTVEDLNAELLACIEADNQGRLVVKVVNNRDYPVFVDFNTRWVGTPSTTVPTEIWTAFLQYTESQFGNTSLYLTGGTEAQVTFEQPTQAGTILTGYARRDIGSVLAYSVFELIGIVGADVPVGGGKTLGIEAIQCYVDVVDSSAGLVQGAVAGSSDELVEAIGGLVSCIDGAVEQGLDQALPATAVSSKLAAAKRYLLAFQAAKYANTVADLLINDRAGSEADLVDLAVFWKPNSGSGFVGWDGTSSELAFEFVRRSLAGEPVIDLVLTMQYTGPEGGVAPADFSWVVSAASEVGGVYEPPYTLSADPAYGDSEGPGCQFEGDLHIGCSVLIEDVRGKRGKAVVSITNPGGSLGVDGFFHELSGVTVGAALPEILRNEVIAAIKRRDAVALEALWPDDGTWSSTGPFVLESFERPESGPLLCLSSLDGADSQLTCPVYAARGLNMFLDLEMVFDDEMQLWKVSRATVVSRD